MNLEQFLQQNFFKLGLLFVAFGFVTIIAELLFAMHRTWAPVVLGAAIIGFFGIGYMLHRYEKQLVLQARTALPGPLESYRIK